MSKKMKRELKELDRLISAFEKIHQDYPKGGYDENLAKLKNDRAELANKIGRKSK
jgi:chorismate mutase